MAEGLRRPGARPGASSGCPTVIVISVLRDGGGFVPSGDSIVQAGDEVLLVLDVEERVTERFTDRSGAAASTPWRIAGWTTC